VLRFKHVGRLPDLSEVHLLENSIGKGAREKRTLARNYVAQGTR